MPASHNPNCSQSTACGTVSIHIDSKNIAFRLYEIWASLLFFFLTRKSSHTHVVRKIFHDVVAFYLILLRLLTHLNVVCGMWSAVSFYYMIEDFNLEYSWRWETKFIRVFFFFKRSSKGNFLWNGKKKFNTYRIVIISCNLCQNSIKMYSLMLIENIRHQLNNMCVLCKVHM